MRKVLNDMIVDSVFPTNKNGNLKIINAVDSYNIDVEFLDTGYKTTARACHIRDGIVKDYLLKSVHGVGFIGIGTNQAKLNGKKSIAYETWRHMLERCHSPQMLKKNPTYIGCSVCSEWHDFQVFCEWFYDNYIEGYHLDKDIKVDNNKIYSPETCLFVKAGDNSIKANARYFLMINPSGEELVIYNLTQFCRENNLQSSSMSNVYHGKQKAHKGWTKA